MSIQDPLLSRNIRWIKYTDNGRARHNPGNVISCEAVKRGPKKARAGHCGPKSGPKSEGREARLRSEAKKRGLRSKAEERQPRSEAERIEAGPKSEARGLSIEDRKARTEKRKPKSKRTQRTTHASATMPHPKPAPTHPHSLASLKSNAAHTHRGENAVQGDGAKRKQGTHSLTRFATIPTSHPP